MKTTSWNLVALTLVATLSATIAQSKFSGIYGCAIPGDKVILAITRGGHIFGTTNGSKGFDDALNPARSTINSTGKIKAVTGDSYTSFTASVSSDFKLKGTGKSGGETFRITGKRTLN